MAISQAIKRQVWDSTWGHCWYCGKQLILAEPKNPESREQVERWSVVDHVIPKSQGGSDDPSNLVPACWVCNSSKGTRSLEEYRLFVAMREAGVPFFKQEQIDWLRSQGFELPKIETMKFWGERPYAARS